MTRDLSLLSRFDRGLLLSLHVRHTCLHSGSWLLSGCVQGLGFRDWSLEFWGNILPIQPLYNIFPYSLL